MPKQSSKSVKQQPTESPIPASLEARVKELVVQALESGDLEFDIPDDAIANKVAARIDALAARVKVLESKVTALVGIVNPEKKQPTRLDVTKE
jgi:hypothetical protein